MPDNKRISYPGQQFNIIPQGSSTPVAMHGIQSVGITTNFNIDFVSEWGQIAVYDTVEQIPDVEVTAEKVLDGHPLIFHLATAGATSGSLIGRSNRKCIVGISIFSDTADSADGVPITEVATADAVISSLNYTFPVDGNCTESVTFVANDKIWRNTGLVFTGAFGGNNDAPIGEGGTQQRDDVVFAVPSDAAAALVIDPADPDWIDINGQLVALTTVLPTDIYGVLPNGTNPLASEDHAHVQSITISCDLGRDQINELGVKKPYFRFVNIPFDVTTEITVIGTAGDRISGNEAGGNNGAPSGSNLKNQSIRVYTKEGTFVTTGTKNKLSSVSQSGGDAGGGGGNVTITYRYTTQNTLIVKHPADPTVALALDEDNGAV